MNEMTPFEELVYWITERENIRLRKDTLHLPPPWSHNSVMRNTYFCNVHREDDRVTKWIRQNFLPDYHMPEFNMMVARLVNKPDSLGKMDWPFENWGNTEQTNFWEVMSQKGSWGSAYIVSTNGRAMPKHDYISGVLSAAVRPLEQVAGAPLLATAHGALQAVQGLGSFMSGQIVADLKNTPGHLLAKAPDWWTWCAHGPGSLRGMAWLLGIPKCSPSIFYANIAMKKKEIEQALPEAIAPMCAQDFQNCLCEFDKFMRVTKGTGRSKRKYPQ